jgi:hypothetical protein
VSQVPVGARVGAILKASETEVHLLGWGVYDGEHEPPFGPFGMPLAELKRDYPDFHWRNPRITLDDGRVVWGAQCWWGPEEKTRRIIGDRVVVPAEVPDVG